MRNLQLILRKICDKEWNAFCAPPSGVGVWLETRQGTGTCSSLLHMQQHESLATTVKEEHLRHTLHGS